MRKLLIVLAIALTSCAGQVDLGRAIQQLPHVAIATPAPAAADATAEAVKAVVERANQAQQKAFATGDASLMRDTATAAYYDELTQINSDLARGGVVGFTLVRIEWGDVTINGTTATATAYETWRTSYSDGSQDQRTDRNDYSLVLESGAWKIQADVQPSAQSVTPGAGTAPAQTQPDTTTTTPARISDTSSNWSGYVANGGTYTSVTGTWIVPQVGATTTGADATWVGIGGVSGTDLIQAGTQATVVGGSVSYEAWIEMLPDSSRTVSLAVAPGDSVTVTITEQSSGEWLIAMANNTTKSSYQRTVRYSSSRSSAEWVQEAPSSGRGIIPLDDFGSVRFTAGSAVRDGKTLTLSALGASAVAMINRSGQVIAQPSTLGADGSSFTITRTSAPGTVQGGGRTFRRRP
ncbi:MAG TPA: G1 family glutamic endopeptidase [Candidatus Limnocylindria bacterium]|nr:G1 family glutamic endopeptidase [Candidatus Limnocylindria bacterium]